MLDLYLRFETFPNLLIFLLLSLACAFWIYLSAKKYQRFNLAPIIAISALLLIIWGRLVPVNMDEVEHLHCSWMAACSGIT